MANLYADEDFPLAAVEALRALGHDVLTVDDAGRKGADDPSQLAFAVTNGRAVVTHNRRDFIRLHSQTASHHGIIVCSRDRDHKALGDRIHEAINRFGLLDNQLLRVNLPSPP